MSTWPLTRKQTATNTVPGTPTGQNLIIQPLYDSINAPLANVTIQAIVTGPTPTATVQPVGSNDGINWENQGSAIAVTAGHAGVTVAASPWAFWGAIVTALGAGGSVDTILSG